MSALITDLAAHQVFIFGSNASGFSFSGSAGMAIRGPNWSATPWREDPWCRAAMAAPEGDPARVGHWGVFGVGHGWSKGHHGMSYAIETVRKPGVDWKRSTPIMEIEDQLVGLCAFCEANYDWEFLHTEIGSGLGGWTPDEMAYTLRAALTRHGGKPGNLVVPVDLYGQTWDFSNGSQIL